MSARAVTLWFLDTDRPVDVLGSPRLTNDVERARELAGTIYGESVLVPAVDTTLEKAAAAKDFHVYAADFGVLSVVSCSLFATTRPSDLTRTVASIRSSAAAILLYVDPSESVGVFARWESGTLRRSFSANPVSIVEDLGLPYVFESPFWGGEHPLQYVNGVPFEPMALPFHPAQLAEEANRDWLGFRFTRPLADTDLDPARIPVTGFAIHPADYEPSESDFEAYRAASEAPADTPDPTPRRPRGRLARYFGFGV